MDGIMNLQTAKIFFVLGTIAYMAIRVPFAVKRRKATQDKVKKVERGRLEKGLVLVVFIGMMVVPLIYVTTDWFSVADYLFLPANAWAGVVLWVIATYLFFRSHKDLGVEWSPVLELKEEHKLITNGVYKKVRHPMYTSIWLFAVAQALLLPNWIVGLSGVVSFGILYFLRVGAEEQMLVTEFGDQYRRYMEMTGRLFLRLSL